MTNNLTFTTKERQYLEDQKNHEQICIQKYTNYANLTTCSQLKNICKQNAQKEQEHYDTLNQLLNGQMPQMGQQSQQQGQSQQSGMGMQSSSSSQSQQSGMKMQSSSGSQTNGSQFGFNATDKDLCTDLLMTEKYVSGAYNTAIFEFRDPQVRQLLNQIQKEEQQHGEAIFKYMESNGMYQVK